MMMRALPVLLLVLLAACVGPEEAIDGREPAEALQERDDGPQTGSLLVVVTTPRLEPIGGAIVTLDNATHITDATGSAHIAELAPGTHLVEAQASGFRGAQALTQIEAGQETRIDLKLLPGEQAGPDAAGDVYRQQFQMQGFFDCSATYLIITGDCLLLADFLVDSVANTTGIDPEIRPGDQTKEEFVLEFPLDAGWKTVVTEMHWDASTGGSDKMTFAVEPAEAPDDGHAAKYARAEGESPLILQIGNGIPHETASLSADGEEPDMPQEAGGEVLRTRSFVMGEFHRPGGTGFLGVGAAVQQEFEVIVTVFYGEPAPVGFTAQG